MLSFDVKYFNAEHENMLKQSILYSELKQLVDCGFKCDPMEYLAYSCFVNQSNTYAGFRNYSELCQFVNAQLTMHGAYFDTTGSSLRSVRSKPKDVPNPQIEQAGVGVALALMSRAAHVTHADWTRIPESNRIKTLDFNLAVSRVGPIIVEAKGKIDDKVASNTGFSEKVNHIKAKKEAQRPKSPGIPMYGIVTLIPNKFGTNSTCYLLDPDLPAGEEDWKKHKILTRLRYYASILGQISQTHLLGSLYTRIRDIEQSDDYMSLSGQPLLNRRGEPFEIPSSLFYSRSAFANGWAFGEVLPLQENKYLFFGLDTNVMEYLIKPDFNDIIRLSMSGATVDVSPEGIVARIPKNWLRRGDQFSQEYDRTDVTRKEIRMGGTIQRLTSGLMLGFVYPS